MVRIFCSLVALAGVMLGCQCAVAQTAQSQVMSYRIKDEAFNHSKVEEISSFMTDELGPRLEGSKMKLRAEKLVPAKLDSLGLTNSRVEFAMEFPKGGRDNERNYVAMTAPYYCSFVSNPKA